MLSGIHTTKPRTQRYIDAFVKGSGQGRIYHFRQLKELPKEDLTMYGILAGSGEVYKDCEKENKKFFFMDHGYFTNAHLTPHWLRITKNKHCQNILQTRPADRYEKNFKQDIKPWKKALRRSSLLRAASDGTPDLLEVTPPGAAMPTALVRTTPITAASIVKT